MEKLESSSTGLPNEQRNVEGTGIRRFFAPQTWEELYALPGISREPVPRAMMVNGTLVGDYEMDPKSGLRPCGIAECHTDHRHGYVVDLLGGVRSYVGRDCGKSQFGVEWTRMRSAYSKQKREQSKAQALADLRRELTHRLDAWRTPEGAETYWARDVLRAFDNLPRPLRDTLENRASTGDKAVIGYRLETAAEVTQRAFRENWKHKSPPPAKTVAYERGPLRGLQSLSRAGRVDRIIDSAIPALHRQARDLIESPAAKPDDFGRMKKRLEDIGKQVGASVQQLQAFVDPNNLALLRYLGPFELAGVVGVHLDLLGNARFVLCTNEG